MQANSTDFVPRIQGLRAVAVLSVLVFHIWPKALPGGYVGVDVFFVISGYLITGALERELSRTGDISLTSFYLRRIRRLLPAASATLLAVTLALPLLPGILWRSTTFEVLASAMYAENWWLTKKSFDYLASDEPPSPVVHFWSLSIEEQWYIVLPATMLMCALLARRLKLAPVVVVRMLLLLIVAASFLCSALLTDSRPTWAYFATATRIWELGIGGLLALTEPNLRRFAERFATPLGLGGLLAIAIAIAAFDEESAFPGVLAALPTLGAALVVLSSRHPTSRFSPLAWLDARPSLFIGDISYSLYLWHWPLIVLSLPFLGGELQQLSLANGIVVAAIALGIATLSKRYVEDPFRYRSAGTRASVTFGLAAASMVAFAAVAWQFQRWESRTIAEGRTAQAGLFARALAATEDTPDVYRRCYLAADDSTIVPCAYGSPTADTHVVIAGDSHAAHWIPTLAELAERRGFRLTAYTKNACPIADLDVIRLRAPYTACTAWREALFDKLAAEQPSLVLLAQSRDYRPVALQGGESVTAALQRGITSTYRRLAAQGVNAVFIADTPRTVRNTNECLSSLGATLVLCNLPQVQKVDPIVLARADVGGRVVQLADHLCSEGRCKSADGSYLIWRDTNHFTASFARSLADRVERIVAPLLAGSASAEREAMKVDER